MTVTVVAELDASVDGSTHVGTEPEPLVLKTYPAVPAAKNAVVSAAL